MKTNESHGKMKNIIFIHGYESSGQGFKGQFLKQIFPKIYTPDFTGNLEMRMKKLHEILSKKNNWIIIGSSYGGLMGSIYAYQYPQKILKLILLAPYITSNEMNLEEMKNIPINIPVVAFHGLNDKVVNLQKARSRAKKIFTNLTYNAVDDDHMLRKTMLDINWKKLVERE